MADTNTQRRPHSQAEILSLALLLVWGCHVPPGGPGPDSAAIAALPSVGRVAVYRMNVDELGQIIDDGPHGLHGTTHRDQRAQGHDGAPDGARLFTTVEDRVDLPESTHFALTGPLTLAARVRVDSLGLHQHIAACDDQWALWVTPDDQFRLGDTRGGGWSTAEGRVERGVWATVVAVLKGTRGDGLTPETVELWVDGERAGQAHLRSETAQQSGAWTPGDLYPADACSLGFESHQGNAAHQEMPFVGALDEFLVYDRAWSAAEVAAYSR